MRYTVCFFVVHAALVAPSFAQTPVQQEPLNQARLAATDPGMTSPYALPLTSVTLETVKGGGKAKATIGFARAQANYRFTFTSPIGDAADAEASPVSVAGLGNNATFELALSRLFLFKRYADKQLLDFCAARGVAAAKCSDQAFSDPTTRNAFLDIAVHRRPTMISFSGQIGAPAFEFLDPTSLEKVEEKLTSWKVTGSFGMLVAPDNVISLNISRARTYSASKDKSSVCRPLTDATVEGAARCDQVTLGKPTTKDTSVLTLEWRRQIVKSNVPMFGLSAQLHVDLDDVSRSAIEVPVYFLQKKPDKESGASLNGGVNAGWSAKDGFVARVFIGAGFKLVSW